MKTKINLIFTISILIVISSAKIIAQPYYFYEKPGVYDSTQYEETIDIYSVNLATGDEQLFIEHIYYPNSFTWDNYQRWFILNQPKGIFFYRPWSNTAIDSLFPDALEDFGVMVYSIDSLGYLYVGWIEPYDSGYGGISNSILLDLNTLQEIKEDVPLYDSRSFISKDLQYIYQYAGRDSLGIRYMFKFSIELDSLIEEISINNLLPSIEYPVFDDGKNGVALFGYNEIMSDSTTCKYVTYDFDNELFSQEIPCPFRCYGHFISNAEYFILEQVLWDESKPGAEYSTGVMYLYKRMTGELLKTFSLPADGKILLFDCYPNNIYYVIDIEEPTRQIYTLKMDSILNVLNLTSLNPSSEIVNSPPFTLTVNGHGFDSLSTVYFNDTAKTTTYISDSVLTAEILTSDISAVGNYPVWVTDEWGTSDTLFFSVEPPPPVLTSISPSLALPVTYYSDNTDFTVTAAGSNFTDSSVIYFDGSLRTTNYVSDSVLTFQLNNYNDIYSNNDYPVWVSNYGSNSDTLNFVVTDGLPASLIPVLNCVRNNGNKTYTAFFGYNNSNDETVFISIGGDNFFGPIQLFADRGQPNVFLPGVHSNVFSVDFDGDNLTWTLYGSSVTANRQSTPCP